MQITVYTYAFDAHRDGEFTYESPEQAYEALKTLNKDALAFPTGTRNRAFLWSPRHSDQYTLELFKLVMGNCE